MSRPFPPPTVVPVTDSDAITTARRLANHLAVAAPDPLPALQQEFPAHRIWRENLCGRIRYIARSPRLDIHPHTVDTSDPDELRTALAAPPHPEQVPQGQTRP